MQIKLSSSAGGGGKWLKIIIHSSGINLGYMPVHSDFNLEIHEIQKRLPRSFSGAMLSDEQAINPSVRSGWYAVEGCFNANDQNMGLVSINANRPSNRKLFMSLTSNGLASSLDCQ